MYAAVHRPFPCLQIATVTAATIAAADADGKLMVFMIAGIEASRTQDTGVVVGAGHAMVTCLTLLEYVPTRVPFS